MVDVEVENYWLPVRPGLQALLAEEADGHVIRPAAEGIAYHSQSMFVLLGQPLERTTWRPRLRILPTKDIFAALMGQDGFRIDLSAAGRYASATVSLWGGLAETVGAIKSPETLALLESFLVPRRTGQPGVYLDGTRRRFLTLEDIGAVTGLDADQARILVDEALRRGVLVRGLVLGCRECDYVAWYPLEHVGQAFACARCRRTTLLQQEAWREPAEPKWYYELVEVVYQAMNSPVHIPLMALEQIGSGARSLLYSHEMDVWDQQGTKLGEFDIWAIRDGEVVIGEANSTGLLASREEDERRRLGRLRTVAERVTADVVIFSTTTDAWRDTTVERARETFEGGGIQLEFVVRLGS